MLKSVEEGVREPAIDGFVDELVKRATEDAVVDVEEEDLVEDKGVLVVLGTLIVTYYALSNVFDPGRR